MILFEIGLNNLTIFIMYQIFTQQYRNNTYKYEDREKPKIQVEKTFAQYVCTFEFNAYKLNSYIFF